MNGIIRNEFAGAMLGVPGRFFNVIADRDTGRILNQTWKSCARPCQSYGPGCTITAEVRFDDNCGNGHESFSITADVRDPKVRRDGGIVACGCMHDEIAAAFPELAHLIPWHLSSTDGPMHYVANTVHLAGDRDCWGRRAGEPSSFSYGVRFGDSPVTVRLSRAMYEWLPTGEAPRGPFPVRAIPHRDDDKPGAGFKYGPHYTIGDFPAKQWHEAPFSDLTAAQEFAAALESCRVTRCKVATAFSDGKARELDAARRCAVWPDATDEELSAEPDVLKAALLARLPALLARFESDMRAAGLLWPERVPAAVEA